MSYTRTEKTCPYVEQTLLKNLNITRFKEMTSNNVDTFDNILKPSKLTNIQKQLVHTVRYMKKQSIDIITN